MAERHDGREAKRANAGKPKQGAKGRATKGGAKARNPKHETKGRARAKSSRRMADKTAAAGRRPGTGPTANPPNPDSPAKPGTKLIRANLLRLLPADLHPDSPHPRAHEGPRRTRSASPPWDLTNVRVRRHGKDRFDVLQGLLSLGGRIPPQWEVFDFLLDAAEAALPPELREILDRSASAAEDAEEGGAVPS